MFDLDALIANKDLILKDRDNRADVQKVLSVYAEKVSSTYTVKAKWSDIFDALLQGMKVQAQVITFTEADEEEETDASAVVETYDLYDATVTADGFKVNGTDLSASGADAYPVGSLSRPSSGGGGTGGGVLVVNSVVQGESVPPVMALDKTWKEIKDAADSGSVVFIKSALGSSFTMFYPVNKITSGEDGYTVEHFSGNSEIGDTTAIGINFVYSTDSEDGYPSIGGGGGGDDPQPGII